jgi:hypothetical protein
MYRPDAAGPYSLGAVQLALEAATDEEDFDFFSPPPEPAEVELPEPPDAPELPESLDELPESLDELDDLAESEPADELSDEEPFEPLAAPSLAGTVLDPVRLSVR